MQTNVVPFQASALAIRNEGDRLSFTEAQLAVIKQTYANDLNDAEFAAFINMAKRRGLDPFRGHVHAVKRSGKLVFQTGIDGFRNLAGRTGEYAGSDEPAYEMNAGTPKRPEKAVVTVYRIVKGQRVAFTGVAYWDEFYPGESQGHMWRKMPRNQLAKCAEAQALRKGFPEELEGIYAPEEMDQAVREAGVIPSKAEEVSAQVNAKPEPREVKSEPDQSAAQCCGGNMMVSKFPNRDTGAFDWYCPKCRTSRPRG